MHGFLFGKLPAFGDFVARGMSVSTRSWWDDWCSAVLRDAIDARGAAFGAEYDSAPPLPFLTSAHARGVPWQAGCLFASRDRVGRAFPLVLGISSDLPLDERQGLGVSKAIGVVERSVLRACAEPEELVSIATALAAAPREDAGAASRMAILGGVTCWIEPRPCIWKD